MSARSRSASWSSAVRPTGRKVADVAGEWMFTARQTSISGGECVGALLQSTIGTVDSGTLSISQTGNVLSATSRSSSTGVFCTYQGTAGMSSIALSRTDSDAAVFTQIRGAHGALLDLRLQAHSVNLTVNGRSGSGTSTSIWNVLISGSSTKVGILISTNSFRAIRR